MKLLLILVLFSGISSASATPPELEEAVCTLIGAASPEELDEATLEHFTELRARPLRINSAGRRQLLASGLLSPYQVASLLDYRERTGDLLSLTELGAVDGFGPRFVQVLSLFVSLEPSGEARGRHRAKQLLTLTADARLRQEPGENAPSAQRAGSVKYALDAGERLAFRWSSRTTWTSAKFRPGTLSLALGGARSKVVAGDYQLRLGQGLLFWSGFSMSGFSGTASFCRNATGLSPTGSFSPGHRGLAAETTLGSWTLCGALSLQGTRASPLGALSLNHCGRNAQWGVQALAESNQKAVSADIRLGVGPVLLWGEAAVSSTPQALCLAALAGASWAPSYGTRLVLLARAYPGSYPGAYAGPARSGSRASDERGLSVGFCHGALEGSLDAAEHPVKGYRQFRALLHAAPSFPGAAWTFRPELRLTRRWRPPGGAAATPRSDLRLDFHAERGPWTTGVRAHFSHAADWGQLFFAEGGFRQDSGRFKLSMYLRVSTHRIPSWEGRIYVYERDFPGSFNTPAYCGTGHALSWIGGLGLRPSRLRGGTHTLRLRASLLRHPGGERATSLGSTRNSTTGIPMLLRASISSFTCMVPSSAANAEPVRPAMTVPVITAPMRRSTPMPMRLAT